MNLSEIDDCSHLCVFCLKQTVSFGSSLDLKDNLQKLKAFTKMLDRFVGGTDKAGEIFVGQLDLECLLLGCCDDCLIIINSFCEVYHKFKCLELELEWKIWKLVRIMKSANKVPSRKLQLENVSGRSNNAKGLRQEIIKSCNKKLAKTKPRVLLQRINISSNISNSLTNVIQNDQLNDNENFAESELEDTLDTLYGDYNDVETENQKSASPENSDASNITEEELYSLSCTPSSPIVENFAMSTTTTVLKSEPINEAETIPPSSNTNKIKLETFESVPTSTTKRHYNLREKRKSNYISQENANKKYSSGYNSPCYSSETTSDDGDSDDDKVIMKINPSNSTPLKRKPTNRSEMKCNLDNCNKRFKNETFYQNHLKLHCLGSFSCKFCSTVKPNLIQLSNHEYEVHNETKQKNPKSTKSTFNFLCPRCPFKAIYFSHYQAHFAHSHFSTGIPPPNKKESWRCDICNHKVWDQYKDHHSKTWHDTDTTTSDVNQIKTCKIEGCTAYFLKDWQLRSHHQKQHRVSKIQKSSTIQCHICLKTFPERKQLLRHTRLLHKIKVSQRTSSNLVCQLCSGGKVFKNNEIHFKNFHQVMEVMKPYNCEKCPAYFRKPFQLQKHKIWAHEKNNECRFCGKSFKRRGILLGHLSYMHKGMNESPDLPFGCKLDGKCNKRFGTEAELDLHQQYGHLMEEFRYVRKKKFICEKCEDGKDFGTRMTLQRHLALIGCLLISLSLSIFQV